MTLNSMMINIHKYKKNSLLVSGILFVVSLIALIVFGLKPGIDFTGGSLLEVSFREARPEVVEIQSALKEVNLDSLLVQPIGDNGYILKMNFIDEETHQRVLTLLREKFTPVGNGENDPKGELSTTVTSGGELVLPVVSMVSDEAPFVQEEKFEKIGSTVSKDLRSQATKASVVAILAIIFFIAYSFRKISKPVPSWQYGLAATIALLHDVVITMGVFAVLGKFWGVEVDVTFVVAILTVFGYSVNDTIVVFDRVRESLIRRGRENFAEIVNQGVNDTLARSINTSMTSLLVLLALFFFGGASIHYFALALIVGIALGAYSSIFVASPLLIVFHDLIQKRSK